MSTRARRAAGLALAALALAVVAAVALATRDRAEPEDAPPVSTRAVVTPRVVLFGDTITAHVQVALDRERADPDTLRITTSFDPWAQVGAPVRIRREGERTTYVEHRWTLRCLALRCVPEGRPLELEFGRARVEYADRDGVDHTFLVRWPVVVTNTRLVGDDFGRDDEYGTPWRADLKTIPAASYRLPPALLIALLVGGALALAAAGAALAYAALPAPRVELPPEPEPEPPPPDLTPLERALELLEAPDPVDGAAGRRRALELVADELHERDASLAGSVRTLAWAAGKPAAAQARSLAVRVRAMLEEERRRLEPAIAERNGAPPA
jgi:hypothetical protein